MSKSAAAETGVPPAPVLDPNEIDELGDAQAKLALTKPLAQREDELKKKFQTACSTLDAAKSFTVYGNRYAVVISPRTNETTVNLAGLFTWLKKKAKFTIDQFLSHVKITGKELETLVPDELQRASFESVERSGYRTVKTVPLPKKKAKA